MKASDLDGIRKAEEKLKGASRMEVADGLPDDHPLRLAAESMIQTGELAGLPIGHPLLIEIDEAKKKFDQVAAEKEEDPVEEPPVDFKKAKTAKKEKERVRREAEDTTTRFRSSAMEVNESLTNLMTALQSSRACLEANSEILGKGRTSSRSIAKVSKTLGMFERALAESKMKRVDYDG